MVWPGRHAKSGRRFMQTHETVSSFRKVAIASNRKFGIVFGLIFGVLGVWPLFHSGSPRWWLIVMSSGFFAAAMLFPRSLAMLNRAWFGLGLVLNRIVSPIVMGGLFFGAVVPLALYLRSRGKNPLSLQLDPDAETYWIERKPPGPASGTMTRQF